MRRLGRFFAAVGLVTVDFSVGGLGAVQAAGSGSWAGWVLLGASLAALVYAAWFYHPLSAARRRRMREEESFLQVEEFFAVMVRENPDLAEMKMGDR